MIKSFQLIQELDYEKYKDRPLPPTPKVPGTSQKLPDVKVVTALEDVYVIETNTATFRCSLNRPDVTLRWYLHRPMSKQDTEIVPGGIYNVTQNGVEHQMNIYNVSCRDEGLVYVKTANEDIKKIDAANLYVTGKH